MKLFNNQISHSLFTGMLFLAMMTLLGCDSDGSSATVESGSTGSLAGTFDLISWTYLEDAEPFTAGQILPAGEDIEIVSTAGGVSIT